MSVIIVEINLLIVPEKVYGRVLTEKLMEVTEGKVSEEQGGLRKVRLCYVRLGCL